MYFVIYHEGEEAMWYVWDIGLHHPTKKDCPETINLKTYRFIKPTFNLSITAFLATDADCVGLRSGSESLLEFISWGSIHEGLLLASKHT